jgi:hypothetical protein
MNVVLKLCMKFEVFGNNIFFPVIQTDWCRVNCTAVVICNCQHERKVKLKVMATFPVRDIMITVRCIKLK